MKFEDMYYPIDVGDEVQFSDDYLINGKNHHPCAECKRETYFLSTFFEAALCSTECYETFQQAWLAAYNKATLDSDAE